MEEWKQCPSFPDYEVSTIGRVRKGTRVSKTHISRDGYHALRVGTQVRKLHRLIAETFLENPNKYPVVDHINRDKTDNRLENLRWATKQQNALNSGRSDGDDKGILFWKNRWQVRVGTHYIGRFASLQEAKAARLEYLSAFNNDETHAHQVAEPQKEVEGNLQGGGRD